MNFDTYAEMEAARLIRERARASIKKQSHPLNAGNKPMNELTARQQEILRGIEWRRLVPLALELFKMVRSGTVIDNLDRFLEILVEIAEIIFAADTQEEVTAQDFKDILELILKYLPLFLELIGKLPNNPSSQGVMDWGWIIQLLLDFLRNNQGTQVNVDTLFASLSPEDMIQMVSRAPTR